MIPFLRQWDRSLGFGLGVGLHARRSPSAEEEAPDPGDPALERVAGKNVVSRIKRVPDPAIISIVDGWPRNFSTERAMKLGFTTAEKTFDDIIRIHIEDELGGNFVG